MNDTDNTVFGTLVETADGSWTVRHPEHGQDFHSSEGARFEAWQLYVVASGLRDALNTPRPLAVLDVGMGLGYNACATIAAWLAAAAPPSLELTSLEIDPGLVRSLVGGEAPWCRGWNDDWLAGPNALRATAQKTVYEARLQHPQCEKYLNWTIHIADAATQEIPLAEIPYLYVWQDPFTPELNPTLWSAEWFARVKNVSAVDVILMTYSVARVVKDALAAGGWAVERIATPGRKRHWLRAKLRS